MGDKIKVGGGIRKATKSLPRILNLEFIQILKLEKKSKLVNPFCQKCKKHMKSKGKNQGFQCVHCKILLLIKHVILSHVPSKKNFTFQRYLLIDI